MWWLASSQLSLRCKSWAKSRAFHVRPWDLLHSSESGCCTPPSTCDDTFSLTHLAQGNAFLDDHEVSISLSCDRHAACSHQSARLQMALDIGRCTARASTNQWPTPRRVASPRRGIRRLIRQVCIRDPQARRVASWGSCFDVFSDVLEHPYSWRVESSHPLQAPCWELSLRAAGTTSRDFRSVENGQPSHGSPSCEIPKWPVMRWTVMKMGGTAVDPMFFGVRMAKSV
jgi:hypothetical protein